MRKKYSFLRILPVNHVKSAATIKKLMFSYVVILSKIKRKIAMVNRQVCLIAEFIHFYNEENSLINIFIY